MISKMYQANAKRQDLVPCTQHCEDKRSGMFAALPGLPRAAGRATGASKNIKEVGFYVMTFFGTWIKPCLKLYFGLFHYLSQ